MYMNGVSIRVIGGTELPSGYVELNHQQTYKLALGNKNDRIADCEVHIDGKHVGTWRIPAFQTITVERPVHEAKLFTFFERDSQEGRTAELDQVTRSDLGLIQAVFQMEKVKAYPISTLPGVKSNLLDDQNYSRSRKMLFSASASADCSLSKVTSSTHNSGGTGLTGESRQEFTQAMSIEYDPSWTTTLSVRLVSKKKTLHHSAPPLQRSNPIPPPLN